MKKEKVARYCLYGLCTAVGVGALAAMGYICLNTPNKVTKPCFRSTHRADGRPKMSFNKPWKANLQSMKQLVKYGEVCNPYQVEDKFYTGHSKNAACRNIFNLLSA